MATPKHWGARPVKNNRDQELAPSVVDSDDTKGKRGKKDLKACNVFLFQEFILSGVKDGNPAMYYGIVCLSDGRVVTMDLNNNRCSLYDSSYKHMSDLMLYSQPWGICTVDTDEVAVTLPREKKIQFLKIGDKINPSVQITTRRMCLSVAALNKMELVYAGTTDIDRTYYWGVITRDGLEKSCFHIPRGDKKLCDVCIVLNSSKTCAYISCKDVGIVYCVGLDGMIHFKYEVPVGSPAGIQLDREDNVYVLVNLTNSIHRLSPDCQLKQIVKDIIPHSPHAICFRQSDDKFLVTNLTLETLNVCNVYILK